MAEWLRLVVFRNKVRNADGELEDEFKGIAIDWFEDEDYEVYDAMMEGCIPPVAEELGIDPSSEIYDIVSLMQHEELEPQGIRAWDEDGRAWYISTCEDDHIWVRSPIWERAPQWDKVSKEEEKSK